MVGKTGKLSLLC